MRDRRQRMKPLGLNPDQKRRPQEHNFALPYKVRTTAQRSAPASPTPLEHEKAQKTEEVVRDVLSQLVERYPITQAFYAQREEQDSWGDADHPFDIDLAIVLNEEGEQNAWLSMFLTQTDIAANVFLKTGVKINIVPARRIEADQEDLPVIRWLRHVMDNGIEVDMDSLDASNTPTMRP